MTEVAHNGSVPSELHRAMIRIQREIQNPLKFKGERYPYVELDTILDVIRPVATAHGIAILQYVDAEGATLITELVHESGESRIFCIPIKSADLKMGSAAQSLGAALTYARKYALMALFAIVGERDTDADPEKIPGRYAPQQPPAKKLGPQPDFETIDWLKKDIRWTEYVDELSRVKNMNVAEVEDHLAQAEFDKVKKAFVGFKESRGYSV